LKPNHLALIYTRTRDKQHIPEIKEASTRAGAGENVPAGEVGKVLAAFFKKGKSSNLGEIISW